MSSDDEQTLVATVQVTNDAWTSEIQHLIGLLERDFHYVDAQMADGKLHVIREPRGSSSSSQSQEGGSMSLAECREYGDELLDGLRDSFRDAAEGNTVSDTEELRDRIETLRRSDQDIADDRTSTLDETRQELDDDTNHDDEADESAEDETETGEDDSAQKSESDSRATCQYCGEPFDPRGVNRHESHCDENPSNEESASNPADADEEDDGDEKTCEHCGDTFPPRGLGPHQRFCTEDQADDSDEAVEDREEDDTGGDESDRGASRGGVSKTPAAIRKAMENPDDLPDEPVPVGVAIQYNAGSYTCKSCDTCLNSDKELTNHVNDKGHRNEYQVNRRRCQ